MSALTRRALLRADLPLAFVWGTAGVFLFAGERLLAGLDSLPWLVGVFAWLFAAILWAAIRVVAHADALAVKLGEPYGTLVLTLSVISIEVLMISALMLTGSQQPTLARDTMFAVVMIVLNGMVGLTLLFGALRYREQSYNLQGANAYLSVIIPLAALSLVMPNYTVSTPTPTLSNFQAVFLILMCVALYGAFLAIQSSVHRAYFEDVGEDVGGQDRAADPGHGHPHATGPLAYHALLLLAYLIPVVLLAKKLAIPVEFAIEEMALPAALGGFVVAALVLVPEALGAIGAALANRLQRSVNISLGSVLATIGLTVPAVLAISLYTGHPVELGLEPAKQVLLLTTLAVAVVTFSAQRTNVLQGLVHLILFLAYVVMIFAP
jgi:Ca2+:H+ antiporter